MTINPALLPQTKLTDDNFLDQIAVMSTEELQELLPLMDAAANQSYARATQIRRVLDLNYAS